MEFKFTCSICNKEHIGTPSFAFDTPVYYYGLTDEEKKKALLSDDLCSIANRDFFVRAILEIPIIGNTEPFLWGVWISQSKENFEYYAEHFDKNLTGRETFGWLSSSLPEYDDTLNLKTNLVFQDEGQRPKVILEHTDHSLSQDFHHGITRERAIEIATKVQHQIDSKDK